MTISGNVALGEQLIKERLDEMAERRRKMGVKWHGVATAWQCGRDEWAGKVIDMARPLGVQHQATEDPAVVGHVIGPGGVNLRLISDATGCRVRVVQVRSQS